MWKFGKSAEVKELEKLAEDIQVNLENNYKDAAQNARRFLGEKLEKYRAEGRLREREYRRFMVLYTEYSARMTGYHH